MKLLDLIKTRTSIRKYKNKKVSKVYIDRILQAGIWGPAIHHFQPWKFIVITNKKFIKRIALLTKKKMLDINVPNFILSPTFTALNNTTLLLCIYNTREFSKTMKRFNSKIYKNFEIAELSAISACIQNMILEIENLQLGSCWLDMPLFCRAEINKLLHQNCDLVGVLTIGYPMHKGKRSPRKLRNDAVVYM